MGKLPSVYKNALIVFILIASSVVFFKMIGRSIWVDEGMLLKSIFHNNIVDFINPLPYYDQAQPFLVSIFHKIVTSFSIDYKFVRGFSLIFCLIPILYVVIKIAKTEKVELYVVILVLFSTILTVGFYLTEIKHYSFEIIATFGIVYIFHRYFNGIYNYNKSIVFIALISSIGFSSIIPASITIAYISILELIKEKKEFFTFKNIATMIVALLVMGLVYLHMKHLTIFQISNHDVYLSKGFFSDIKSLAGASLGAYGKVFILLSAVISILTLFFINKKEFLFQVNLLFLIIVFLVVFAKIIGVYPVISDRHIVWIVPFNIFIVSLFMNASLKSNNKKLNLMIIPIFLAFFLQVGNIIYKTYTTELKERTANNKLYEFVENLKPSFIVVSPLAQPSLEYYLEIDNSLQKHQYSKMLKIISESKDTNLSKDKYWQRIDDSFSTIPAEKFYYLLSHSQHIDEDNKNESSKWRNDYLLEILKKYNCKYNSIFKDYKVQVLEMECKNATNSKP